MSIEDWIVGDLGDARSVSRARTGVGSKLQGAEEVVTRGVSDGVFNQNSGTFSHVESSSHVVDRLVEDHQHGVYEVVEVERLPTSPPLRISSDGSLTGSTSTPTSGKAASTRSR